ncbi:MAG TPA: hypothetical protein VJU79_03125, partial [Candidatus Dormibacteraeota bacterium]|nr:hypothetical protein [Candidatus Dormibacteraeota bacterium]
AEDLPVNAHSEDIAEAYGISPSGAVLVRPDGYVAWRAQNDASASRETLARTFASILSTESSVLS